MIPRLRWSLRRRVAVSAAAATAVVAILLAVATVAVAAFLLHRQVDDELRTRAGQLVEEIRTAPIVLGQPDDEVQLSAPGRAGPSPGLSRVIDSFGRVELGTSLQSLAVDPDAMAVAAGDAPEHLTDTAFEGGTYRVLTAPVRAPEGSGLGLAIQVAKPIDDIDRALVVLGVVGMGVSVVGLALAALAASWVSRAALAPVADFTRAVSHVAETGDLSTTVPADGATELRQLGASFNDLMGSLAESRAQQRQLIADAGHELRTPLTSIRTNLELLSDGERLGLPAAERDELLEAVNEQFEELSSLVADVVALARDDAATEAAVLSEVRLDRVVERAAERARRRAGGIGLEVTTTPAVLDADATLLERAVLNVLDNAIKWSPPHGVVELRQDGGVVVVDDAGPGIAVEDRARVFERFWRADSDRSVPGSGLGLAIVAQVMGLHRGDVRVEESPGGGTRVVMTLPSTSHLGER